MTRGLSSLSFYLQRFFNSVTIRYCPSPESVPLSHVVTLVVHLFMYLSPVNALTLPSKSNFNDDNSYFIDALWCFS